MSSYVKGNRKRRRANSEDGNDYIELSPQRHSTSAGLGGPIFKPGSHGQNATITRDGKRTVRVTAAAQGYLYGHTPESGQYGWRGEGDEEDKENEDS